MQRELGITDGECGALDVRNQCSGFVYSLSVADKFIRSGSYRNVLVVCSEMHSMGLDFTTRGRGVTVLFGDGAAAVVLQPTKEEGGSRILADRLHSDGTYAEKLAMLSPGSHGGKHLAERGDHRDWGFAEPDTYGGIFLTEKIVEDGHYYPVMEGQFVFKLAVRKLPEVIHETLAAAGMRVEDIDLLILHQANLRIAQLVQRNLGLSDDRLFNNIQRYGNTTATSIPLAFSEAVAAGKLERGQLVVFAAFGSGFTWGATVVRY